jgi:PEP-CTERM motif
MGLLGVPGRAATVLFDQTPTNTNGFSITDFSRTGQSALCPTCASATFSIAPLPLAAGTYWLELHAGTSFTDTNGGFDVDWAAVDDNATLIARNSASGLKPDTPVDSSGFNQYAFQAIGTTVPEPGALTLLAVGLFLFAVKGRRPSGR